MLQAAQLTGLTALQLVQLCQAEHIEETMRLLFALNHWAKARERLFFADRQGLYALKTALLRQAYSEGLLTAKAYIDGKEGFGQDLSFEIAADIAAEGFLWRLEELAAGFDKEREDVYERIVHRLYTRITDKQDVSASDVEALETSQVHGYILACLRELEREARTSGQPIPYNRLTELCIAPSDLLSIQDRRYYDLGDWYSWDELDASDLRKLDPEGLSLIAFDYTSPTSHYIFHLPLRLAEVFVPYEQIALLKRTPWTSRESGEYFGRAVTEAESLQQPIADILHELGADVMALCPRQLSDKQEILFFQHTHYAVWDDEEFEADDVDEDDEEFDRDKARQMALYWHTPGRSSLVTGWPGPDLCPSCSLPMDIPPGPARVEHWQQKHPGQDLTISQAGWMLDCRLEKKIFCQHYPPDYRAPHERGFGTRYWKVETLQAWIHEKEETGLKR